MRGLRQALTLLLSVVTVVTFVRTARAVPLDAGVGVSCAAVEQRLEGAQRTLEQCERQRERIVSERAACNEELASTQEKLGDTTSRESACRAKSEVMCTEAAGFARAILEGRVQNVGSCVPSQQQLQLSTLLRGWENTASALAQLNAFASGESDTMPGALGGTPQERLLARLVGGPQREPLIYRRLLVEAIKLAAPQTWQRIRGKGGPGIEPWFAKTDALDRSLVEEVERGHSGGGQGGAPVSAALRLVQSYILLAKCADDSPNATCTRARQLQQLFESTGPLLVRRRIEDVWATDCVDLGPDRVLGWVQDFPTPHLSAGPADYSDVAAAAHDKIFTCFLADQGGDPRFKTWIEPRLPSSKQLNARTFARVEEIRGRVHEGTPTDLCGRAIRAMQDYAVPASCEAPPKEIREPMERWAEVATKATAEDGSVALQACAKFARLQWEGHSVVIGQSFPVPPSLDEIVRVGPRTTGTPFERLRRACQDRQGEGEAVAESIRVLAATAKGFGEAPANVPWRVDTATDLPIESSRFGQKRRFGAWVEHLFTRETSCQALALAPARCQQCSELSRDAFYDCHLDAELERSWSRRARTTTAAAVGAVLAIALVVWGIRLRRARRKFLTWFPPAQKRLATLGLAAEPEPLRWLLPSHHDVLIVTLPSEPAWEPWGTRACVVYVDDPAKIQEGDIHHAVGISRRVGARVVFLLHEDTASLDLGAVRTVLDWAAKGGTRTMHVLPLAVSRLAWAHNATDLLELVEETSLRGNPFDTRGRITSSSQFWNRERLVSGLLAETRAGRWLVVTGLRRFGKSSLALEVARRVLGPSAYVDLAGFHHEFALQDDPSRAASAVLRSLCARLVDSARALYPHAEIPDAPEGEVDAAALTRWIRDLSAACTVYTDGIAPPILLILDELEQLLTIGPERLRHVLDALSILLGRLRNAVGDAPHPGSKAPVGLLICSALHPLLWAPFRTLGQQSIAGAFPVVCVPRLSPEAAVSMMRGLGARQGIRFTDEALSFIVEESQSVPLLLRRIGSSILELYDADHARQGALGAVQIGIEGAREAVALEERAGAPLRVWVESEIAEATGPAGAMLRTLAEHGVVPAQDLRDIAERHVLGQFALSGLTAHLPQEELLRRAVEAASVMLRLLGESGLVLPVGDLTAPEAYELPEGNVRRVLRAAAAGAKGNVTSPSSTST